MEICCEDMRKISQFNVVAAYVNVDSENIFQFICILFTRLIVQL